MIEYFCSYLTCIKNILLNSLKAVKVITFVLFCLNLYKTTNKDTLLCYFIRIDSIYFRILFFKFLFSEVVTMAITCFPQWS